MSITVKIPTQLRDAVGGAAKLQAEGATVGEALESVFATHEELRDRLYQEDGDLRRFINVYLGGEVVKSIVGARPKTAIKRDLDEVVSSVKTIVA